METKPPVFFASQQLFHKWLENNHSKAADLWVGFYSVKSGRISITYKQAVDEALCFGWIDGIRKGVDEECYTIRFTPRKKNSIWSNVNTERMKELIQEGKVHEAGLAAFNQRTAEKAGVYSFEQDNHSLSPAFLKKFKANRKAWNWFSTKAPWYQRTCFHWVMSAKQDATREKRLETLIRDSENETTIKPLTRTNQK